MPSNSSSPNSNAVSEVEVGLAALQRGDYTESIARLEATSLPSDHPLAARAQMGLVVAYAKQGQSLQAATLCQSLCQSSNSQLREWATRTYDNLVKRYPYLEQTASTGDEPSPEPETDLTGFTPLETSSNRASHFARSERNSSVQPLPTSGVATPPTSPPPLESAALPSVDASSPIPPAEAPAYQPTWRQAERATRGQSLGKVKQARFWLVHLGTAIALFWVLRELLYQVKLAYCTTLVKIPFLDFRYTIFHRPTWIVLVFLAIAWIGSRWILDALLKGLYGLEPLSLSQLRTHSPEAAQSLQAFCHQRRLPLPTLGVLPIAAPMAFSYGGFPRIMRTVVSQGLLEQLADDEIATIYAHEIGQIANWTVPLMSLVTVVTQIPYTLYWQITEWGKHQASPIVRFATASVATISYTVYGLIRWVALWLSRQRVYFSDRTATELTGNPNGHIRALVKLAIGTAREVQKRGSTPYLLEGFDLLTPLGYPMATTVGSVYAHAPLEAVLDWERINPYRHWLSINHSHPPTGDRLQLLTLYARHWKLEPELHFGSAPAMTSRQRLTGRQWRSLLSQAAPFLGFLLACGGAVVFSWVGWWAFKQQNYQLSWLYRDQALITGLPLIGFSLGTLLRLNRFFPDHPLLAIGARQPEPSTSLVTLLKNPATIPLDSPAVCLSGKILGRADVGNVLSQDLLLQTDTGIIRLHWTSRWGPVGNLFPQPTHPSDLLNQEVVITGWFRRGAVPWIDIRSLQTARGQISYSDHPNWSAILAIVLAILGALIIARG